MNYKNNRKASYSQLLKATSVSKNLIPATASQVDNLPSKMFICSDHLEKKNALILVGNFKITCTMKTAK